MVQKFDTMQNYCIINRNIRIQNSEYIRIIEFMQSLIANKNVHYY